MPFNNPSGQFALMKPKTPPIKAPRVKIYIDGANFLYGLKSLRKSFTDFNFDFQAFSQTLCTGRALAGVNYYNATLKKALDANLYSRQQRMFARLRKEGIRVILCKRQSRFDTQAGEMRYQIKGDDIQLAIDMLDDAFQNRYDVGVLVSGDGDFTPLVRKVRQYGKQVEIYYFQKLCSSDLRSHADSARVITRSLVARCDVHKRKIP